MILSTFKYGQGIVLKPGVDFNNVFEQLRTPQESFISITAPAGVDVRSVRSTETSFNTSTDNELIRQHRASNHTVHIITIPPNTNVETPIFIKARSEAACRAETVLVNIGENAHVKIVESSTITSSSYNSYLLRIEQRERSELTYTSVTNHTLTPSFAVKEITLHNDAKLMWLEFPISGTFSSIHNKVILQGHRAEAQFQAAVFAQEKDVVDLKCDMIYRGEKTIGNMSVQGVLLDSSKAVFRGIINMPQGSLGAVGNQHTNFLLIGEKSRCDAVPVLEVDHDAVQCSHGATATTVLPEHLYYLGSRGISEEKASHLIVESFLDPIISRIENEKTRQMIHCHIKQKIDNL